MSILEKIVNAKKKELEKLKALTSYSELEGSEFFGKPRPSFRDHLLDKKPSIIAEFKRRSPSKGQFKENVSALEITRGYEMAGAAAVSVLTDVHFDGKKEDILEVAGKISIPILRKDFIIDEFQILEAKAIGASAILLIASVLKKDEIIKLNNIAKKLGLDVLLELHDLAEIDKIPGNLDIVGINNRNLSTFEVDLDNSIKLAGKLPAGMIKVSESGIDSVTTIKSLHSSGFDAFLIGENFMKSADPAASAKAFISELEDLISG